MSSNIKNGVNIFGVTGSYGSTILTEHVLGNFSATVSKEELSGTNRYAWCITATLPLQDRESNYIDYNSVVYVELGDFFSEKNGVAGIAKTGYSILYEFTGIIQSLKNSIAELSTFGGHIEVSRTSETGYATVYTNRSMRPSSSLNLSTREVKLRLSFNYGDGLLDNYLKENSYTSSGWSLYTL